MILINHCNTTTTTTTTTNYSQRNRDIYDTSQCQPPRPTAFLTTPWRPTSTDLVRLFPVTTTLVWRGSTESSSSLLSPQLCKCDECVENPPLLSAAASSSISKFYSIPKEWTESWSVGLWNWAQLKDLQFRNP